MAVFRRRLVGGGCPAKGLVNWLGSLTLSNPSAVRLDTVHKLWLCVTDFETDGSMSYGAYTKSGMTLTGSAALALPTDHTNNLLGLALDPAGFWWSASKRDGNRLYYGTYDTTTGEPAVSGYVALPVVSSHALAVDIDRRLWWTPSHIDGSIVYGTYDASGVPTVGGTYSISNPYSLGIDPVLGLLFMSGTAGDIVCGTYDPDTGAPVFAAGPTAAGSYWGQIGIDPVRRYLWVSEDYTTMRTYQYDATGAVTLLYEEALPAENSRLCYSVDTDWTVIAASGYGSADVVFGQYCKL